MALWCSPETDLKSLKGLAREQGLTPGEFLRRLLVGSPETAIPAGEPQPGALEYTQESAEAFNPRQLAGQWPENVTPAGEMPQIQPAAPKTY